MTYTTPGGHDWIEQDDGTVDFFATESGYHNGPVCRTCLEVFCEHCKPGCLKELCQMVLSGIADVDALTQEGASMSEPRIVSPEEAYRAIDETMTYKVDVTWRELARTVATEPDRTRAAVVKALRDYPCWDAHVAYDIEKYASAIENGADY